jgi:hypothetical protein
LEKYTEIGDWQCSYIRDRCSLMYVIRLCLKCDGTRAETRFRLSPKRTSPFKSAGASVQSTTGSRVVRISGSNVGYTMFRGNVNSTGYPLHSLVSPSIPPRAVPCAVPFQLDSTKVKVKVKFTLEEATKAQRGSRGTAVLFL